MTKLKAIYQLIALLVELAPSLSKVFRAFVSLEKTPSKETRKKIKQRVSDHVEHVKKTQDTSRIERIFNNL